MTRAFAAQKTCMQLFPFQLGRHSAADKKACRKFIRDADNAKFDFHDRHRLPACFELLLPQKERFTMHVLGRQLPLLEYVHQRKMLADVISQRALHAHAVGIIVTYITSTTPPTL